MDEQLTSFGPHKLFLPHATALRWFGPNIHIVTVLSSTYLILVNNSDSLLTLNRDFYKGEPFLIDTIVSKRSFYH